MRGWVLVSALAVAVISARAAALSDGWLFRLGDDDNWRAVKVPHDWAIEGGFLPVGTDPHRGDLPYVGKGCYRRALDGFTPPEGGRTYLTLDGVQCRSVVKLNGKVVGGRPFGYASETIDVTECLLPTGNVLEVEAENVKASSRWYPGSGIFRDVTVRVCPRDHVKPNTLFVRTLSASEKEAQIAVSFEWRGGISNFTFAVKNPRLWSPESPSLYELELFGETFRYGIRTADFDPQRGFFLNGHHRQMRGVCLHHDLGPLGAAFDRDAARRQLTLLKEMGCDAIRTSHNPPAAALLDLCDEMGVMVMDEAFDMWEEPKGDYSNFWKEWHVRDLAEFVRRDRSHPSVVMWSIGNELAEFEDKTPERQIRIASELTAIVKANDPTRPVTVGSWKDAPMWNGLQNAVDAFGANYLPFKYAEFSRRNPKVGLVGTETCSTVSSRCEYFFPVVASSIDGEGDLKRRRDEGRGEMVRGAQMSGYDLWGPHANDYPPDIEFAHQEKNPQVYGEFVWTGFDYLGEPDPCSEAGGRSSYFGIFDLAGFPKDRYWLYKSQWRPEEPTAHILPHWTWPGREGEVTPVHVYTSGDEAELFVNGVSQGRKRRGHYEYRFRWDEVRYASGELRVKTWRKGREWAEDVVRTAGDPVRVERTERRFGRLTFVTFALKDGRGTVCPHADRALAFTMRPGTRLVALCNGDASSHEDFRGVSMRTFHGLLLAVVEGDAEGLEIKAASFHAIAAENTQAEQRRERNAEKGCVTVDPSVEVGKIKIMHAVNNGPNIGKLDQYKSNEHSYKTARIPYARLHDASFCWNWGGNHTVDIDGVFPNFDADENDPKSYDFTFTDFYLKGIRKAGTEPFYRLGQKIEHGIKKYGILPPKDFAKWARICDHIVRHYNEGWADGYHWNIKYWEIWNEPDLDWEKMEGVKKGSNGLALDPRTWGGSAEQFLDLYETTAKLLKTNHPDIMVGGPAVAWNQEWAKMFLGEMKKRGVAMDFFSWHIYTRYPASLAQTAAGYRKMLDDSGYVETESICNEWNYARDWQGGFVQTVEYETTMPGAAFVAGCFCAGQNSPVDMLMYYDARPTSGMNGLWDAQTLQPIWGYYAIMAWSKLYADLGMQVKVSLAELNDRIHCVAAKNPETGKVGIFLVRYMEPSEAEHWHGPIRVSVKLAKGSLAGCVCHLTDASHMGSEYVPEFNDDGSITLWLMPQSFCFIEK